MFNFIENYDINKNVNINYINEVERKFNITFPNILKEFYLKYNYSNIKECDFDIVLLGAFLVEDILPLKYGNYNFEKIYTTVLESDWIAKEFIPFATDISGDHFYWNSNSGKVYYISHEDCENPILICNNIDEFFTLMNKCCNQEKLIPNLNSNEEVNIDNTKQNNFKNILKYNGIFLFILGFIFLTLSLFLHFYINPIDYFFTNFFGCLGLMLLFIDLNRRINSNITLKKHDINLLESELINATKLHQIDTFLTKNYIISNSKRVRITKYDDIEWIFVPTQKGRKGYLKSKDTAYQTVKTPIVAYLKNKKKVTVALVKKNKNIKLIFNRVIANNKNAMIGNTDENKIKYEKINNIYKFQNTLEKIAIYAIIIISFIAFILSLIMQI